MTNVLLELNSKPRFDAVVATDIAPALNTLMADVKAELTRVKAVTPVTWETHIEPITAALEKVSRAWNVVHHLNAVVNSPELRAAYNEMVPIVTDFFTQIGQDRDLYDLYRKLKESPEYARLTPTRQRILTLEMRDFELSGVALPLEKKRKFAGLQGQLSQLSSRFSHNVMDATDAFSLYIADKEELAGVPENVVSLFHEAASRLGKEGYQLDLQRPSYQAVLRFAENRALRQKMHEAYGTRASDLGENQEWDNTPLINEILATEGEEAELLGYPTAADLSLVPKMASSVKEVTDFINEIIDRAKPVAEKEWQELRDFAADKLQLEKLEPWDIAFASEKLREEKYQFSEEEVKRYFTAGHVLSGLFQLIHELYGVIFVAEDRPVWHPDVRYFKLTREGKDIGGVYLDLYARTGKRGGAWMDAYCDKWTVKNQLPIAFLVANFTPGAKGESYLTHDEITTLFHEMGHSLQQLLTEVPDVNVAGINGVEWDAVELPSQFMENFAWEYGVLAGMSRHPETGKPLPRELFNKMRAAKNFQVGLMILRQMEFALFDFSIFASSDKPVLWTDILAAVRKETSILPRADYDRFAQSFEHIFAGGYTAGYYSYMWAEVLAADVYAAFLENPDRGAVGQLFLRELLARGGSRSAMESFIAFRGRKPEIAPLFQQLGLE